MASRASAGTSVSGFSNRTYRGKVPSGASFMIRRSARLFPRENPTLVDSITFVAGNSARTIDAVESVDPLSTTHVETDNVAEAPTIDRRQPRRRSRTLYDTMTMARSITGMSAGQTPPHSDR